MPSSQARGRPLHPIDAPKGRRTKWQLIGPAIVLVVLAALPAGFVLNAYSSQDGFLRLIYFGQNFKESSLPEVQAIDPPRKSEWGYDGQFYAQVALVPLLNRDDLSSALDNPTYRARRIGLPLLAFSLGLGKPALVLQLYAVLNCSFWLFLLAALYRLSGFRRSRNVLLAAALLWSTGTLVSIARALPDFPAAALGVIAVVSKLHWTTAALLFAVAGLFKETSMLSFIARAWPDRDGEQGRIRRWLMTCALMVGPLALWILYVHSKMSGGMGWETDNFSWPFSGISRKLYVAGPNVLHGTLSGGRSDGLFELLCPISLLVQSAYLFLKPRTDSKTWRFGIGFAVLLCCLGDSIWVEQYAYARVLLPLTFSFNLLLHEHERGACFATWYLPGNVGMAWLCLRALVGR